MITQDRLTERLDELEETLPTIASKTVAFGRATTRRTTSIATAIIDNVAGRFDTVADTIGAAGRTTSGQASSVAERTATTVGEGASEVTGQARAQGSKVADAVADQAGALVDDATDAVDPTTRSVASFDDLTKAELYSKAQDRDIEGRASMSKTELVAALRR